jgi:putative intracellular protease/amidase
MSLQDPNVVNPARKKRVAIVIANPATSTTTGWPVGFWWSELTHSYYLLTESGYEIEVFSPDGGACKARCAQRSSRPKWIFRQRSHHDGVHRHAILRGADRRYEAGDRY